VFHCRLLERRSPYHWAAAAPPAQTALGLRGQRHQRHQRHQQHLCWASARRSHSLPASLTACRGLTGSRANNHVPHKTSVPDRNSLTRGQEGRRQCRRGRGARPAPGAGGLGCPAPCKAPARGPLPREHPPGPTQAARAARDAGRAPDTPGLLGEEIFAFQPPSKFLSALDQAETVKPNHRTKCQDRKRWHF